MVEWVSEILNAARQEVAASRNNRYFKVVHKGYYLARKQLLHAPRTLTTMAASHVPIVGGIAAQAVGVAVQYVVSQRQNMRRSAAALERLSVATDESFGEAAKWDAKDLKDVAAKIDSNQVKLSDTLTELNAAVDYYQRTWTVDNITQDAAPQMAFAIMKAEYYEDKILSQIMVARERLTVIEDYVLNSRASTLGHEIELVRDLTQLNNMPPVYDDGSVAL
jgi:hypothetical protein